MMSSALPPLNSTARSDRTLTMRLSDAGLHQRQTKALYPNHRLPPWPNEDATRDRSNRLLGDCASSPSMYIRQSVLRRLLRRYLDNLRKILQSPDKLNDTLHVCATVNND